MRQLFSKLHSERGTSMLMALVFFLFSLSIGSILLTSATADAVKTKDRYAEQQAYETVASAARLLKAELSGYGYTTGTRQVADVDPETGEELDTTHPEPIPPYVTAPDGATVPAGAGSLLTDCYAAGIRKTAYTVKAEGLGDVTASVTMAADGTASILLTTADSAYAMVLAFPATTAAVDTGDMATTTVSWAAGDVSVSKGAAG